MPSDREELSFVEEFASAVTHGIGLVLALGGLAVLVVLAALRGTALHIVSCAIYGSTLVLLYTASTLYHSIRSPRAKRLFRVLDHAAIYLLIAGTYTPFAMVHMQNGLGWWLLGLVWTLAIAGIVFKCFHVDRFPILSTLSYVAMGWLVVIAWKPVSALLPGGSIHWIVGGGLAYTAGVIFFAWEKLRFNHAIWHLFVLAGSICHYVAVLLYVLPARA